jgi:lysozyme
MTDRTADLQRWLTDHGYDAGPADGDLGDRTYAAVLQALGRGAGPTTEGDDAVLSGLLDDLQRDEGFSTKPYRDTRYGTNLDAGLTRDEARYLLRARAVTARSELRATWPALDRLDPARQRAVLNMAYNLGVPTLLRFTDTLRALEAGRWEDAARHALDSRWARQVGQRANRLAAVLRAGA